MTATATATLTVAAPDILPLRDYQSQAITAIEAAWRDGMMRPAVVLPTGAGKTVIFAHLAKRVHAAGLRTLVLVHTTELVSQAVDKLRTVAPHLRVGIVKAQLNETDADVVVATVQTLRSASRLDALRGQVGAGWLTVVDECHHATATSYRVVLDGIDGPKVGFTATMHRADGAALGDVWDKVVYRRDIRFMIKSRHLLPVRGKRLRVPDLDLSRVRRTAGDLQADETADALSAALAPEIVAKYYLELAGDRQGILFAPTVSSADEFAIALNSAGVTAEMVHGGMPAAERIAALKRLRLGQTQVISNCAVLTEGFDEPAVSCAVIARPTTSPGLYTQMVGRVLRPHRGQVDALVIDVVGVTGRHRLASLVDLDGDSTLKRKIDDGIEDLTDMLLDEDGFSFDEPAPEAWGGNEPVPYIRAEQIQVTDVDLFAQSHSAWLTTVGGTYFLPCSRVVESPADGDGWSSTRRQQLYVFITPAGRGGTYNVAMCDEYGRGTMPYRRIELDAAMAWGEEVVKEYGGGALINKTGAWRKKAVLATDAQKNMARRLGIDHAEDVTKAELSDMISVHKASKIIDGTVRQWSI